MKKRIAKKPGGLPPQPLFDEPTFNEVAASPDPSTFKTGEPSDAQLYNQIQGLLTRNVVGFLTSRAKPGDLYTLQSALGSQGPAIVQAIQQAGQIVFHAIGDSGSSNVKKYQNEISVADQLADDCHAANAANRPAFLFHLGDVVYDFGQSQYYYDQFYEPYRDYPGPIFAIPGNHDSFIVPNTPPSQTPLTIFMRNFCATAPAVTQEAASLHRTAMTQPGVYFTLDAPFVRIIGLFSNALEDPGLISSENQKWPGVPDVQLAYLTAQLQNIKNQNYQGAVLLAVHHPPFCYSPPPGAGGSGGDHGSSPAMLAQIDTICQQVGIYPHAFLSGHAHNYQRYTRTVHFGGKSFDVPFVVCGDGGHNVSSIVKSRKGQPPVEPGNGADVSYLDSKPKVQTGGLLLEHHNDTNYGYLRVSVDAKQLRIAFHQAGGASLPQSNVDQATADLASHTMVSN